MTTWKHYYFGESITAIMSSANHFRKNKRSIKKQMAIAQKSCSVRRNIEDRLSARSSDTDNDATIIIDKDPIPSTSIDESNHLSALIRTSNKDDWMIVGRQKFNELFYIH